MKKNKLGQLIDWIKFQLEKIWGDVYYILLEKGQASINITNILKYIVENETVNVTVALSPNKVDDVILALGKKLVKEILAKLGVLLNIVQATEDPETAFEKTLEYVRTLPLEGRGIIYREFSGLLAEFLSKDSDGGIKITRGERIALLQFIYKGLIKK
jgi:hypothetical protein